jgi:signal recognition particle subunit SRP54
MTPVERTNPKMLDGSRRARIAKGSGTQVSDVNSLVNRFFEARKMMQSLAGGIPGLPGARRPAVKQVPKKKKGNKVSGNPAKRTGAPEAKAIEPAAPASAFRRPQPSEADLAKAVGDFQLPAELQQLFNPKSNGPR